MTRRGRVRGETGLGQSWAEPAPGSRVSPLRAFSRFRTCKVVAIFHDICRGVFFGATDYLTRLRYNPVPRTGEIRGRPSGLRQAKVGSKSRPITAPDPRPPSRGDTRAKGRASDPISVYSRSGGPATRVSRPKIPAESEMRKGSAARGRRVIGTQRSKSEAGSEGRLPRVDRAGRSMVEPKATNSAKPERKGSSRNSVMASTFKGSGTKGLSSRHAQRLGNPLKPSEERGPGPPGRRMVQKSKRRSIRRSGATSLGFGSAPTRDPQGADTG